MELRREHADLAEERDGILGMLADDKAQWKLVWARGSSTPSPSLAPAPRRATRRSIFADAPDIDADAAIEAMIPREPITVILSDRGWIRAARGRVDDPSS